jgi:hypothetical protein
MLLDSTGSLCILHAGLIFHLDARIAAKVAALGVDLVGEDAQGEGLGIGFLRHVQRSGSAESIIRYRRTINPN